jgi:hypothetical protein
VLKEDIKEIYYRTFAESRTGELRLYAFVVVQQRQELEVPFLCRARCEPARSRGSQAGHRPYRRNLRSMLI